MEEIAKRKWDQNKFSHYGIKHVPGYNFGLLGWASAEIFFQCWGLPRNDDWRVPLVQRFIYVWSLFNSTFNQLIGHGYKFIRKVNIFIYRIQMPIFQVYQCKKLEDFYLLLLFFQVLSCAHLKLVLFCISPHSLF